MKAKTTEKTFLVDLDWVVTKTYEIKAKSKKEAEKKIEEIMSRGDVCVWTDDFFATDETRVKCVGEIGQKGELNYY